MQNVVYLKKINDDVEAYGDIASADRGYDRVVSIAEWEKYGCHAYVKNGTIALGFPEAELRALHEESIRNARAERLQACDGMNPMRWEMLPEGKKQEWRIYRQALLDVPQRPGFPWDGDPDKVAWPKKPE